VRTSMSADVWQGVRDELTLWEATGQQARFWFRDDDAICATPALRRLEALASRHGIEIGIAIIPGTAQPELVGYMGEHEASLHPMCHGWMHEIYKSIEFGEFGAGRPRQALRVDAVRALKRFQSLFPGSFPVFVPPFGRLDTDFIPELLRIGFAGVSNKPSLTQSRLARVHAAFGWLPPSVPRFALAPALLDVHIDPIDWMRSTAHPEPAIAAQVLGELRLRRKGYVRQDAPIGILTHHLVHDEAIWTAVETLVGVLAECPASTFARASVLAGECRNTIRGGLPERAASKLQWRDAINYD